MPTSHEIRFADQAEALGVLDRAAIDKAIRVAETIRDHDKYADARTVLVGRQKLSDEDADRVLAAMGSVVMFCAVCGKKYALEPYDPGVVCPDDDAPLKPVLAPRAAQPIKRSSSREVKAPPARSPAEAAGETRPAGDSLLGSTLGRFSLTELFAADSTSRTYKATLARTDMPFMVKVLTTDERVAHRRFLREAKYASLIQHPNVVRVLASGASGSHSWIAMEYIDGIPLDQVIDAAPDKQLAIRDALHIAVATLDGLDVAHQIGIIHRNIKPGNLIATDDGARIINFNSARLADESSASGQLTAPGGSLGTPHYMAPEQFESSKVDYRADLYSFGSTLFQMVTGRPPFVGAAVLDIVKAKLRTDAPAASSLNANVPLALDEVVATLLARTPGGRYASAGHASVALRAISA
jgi:serine/threonine protein kinase